MLSDSDKKYKFSIIIPAFNVGQYIQTSIASVCLSEISAEIIVVNDGSTDNTLEVIESCANEFDNIVIVNKENAGLSAARNSGVEKASGDYLIFLDGDDWLDKQSLLSLNYYLTDHADDIVILDFVKYWREGETLQVSDSLEKNKILTGINVFKYYLEGNVTIAATNKVFRRDLFVRSGFQFPEAKLYEDVPLGVLFYDAERVVYLNYPFYFYRQRVGSITKTFNPRVYEKHDVVLMVRKFLDAREAYHKFENEFHAFYVKVCLIQMSIFVLKSNLSLKEKKVYIHTFFRFEEAKEALKNIFKNPFVSKKELVFLFIARDATYIANRLINFKNDSL